MRVAAVVLNWRGWRDTLECLESVLRTDPAPEMLIVCDNASDDGSVDRIVEWAEGRLQAPVAEDAGLRRLTTPPVPKPIGVVRVDARGAAPAVDPIPADPRAPSSGDAAGPRREESPAPGTSDGQAMRAGAGPVLVLLETGANRGYAGGNNVGIRYAMANREIDAVWILNNDTVVDSSALGEMIRTLGASPRAGMCGSTLLYHDRPAIVQTLGGAVYDAWTALPRHIGEGEPLVRAPSPEEVMARMDYVNGASMLVTRAFIEDVGLMDEGYFLYFEELDWVLRARGRYTLAYAPGSIVFHKEGRSIGTEGPERKSELSDHWFHRNRLEITRRYFPTRLWSVRLALVVSALRRARRGQWGRARGLLELARRG